MRRPLSLLLGKSVGPDNFWLRQFKIVGVGATIGSSVEQLLAQLLGLHFWAPKTVGPTNGPKDTPTEGPKLIPTTF